MKKVQKLSHSCNLLLPNLPYSGKFVRKLFLQMIHVGNIKGVAWQHFWRNLILQLSQICEICENKVTQKYPVIQYYSYIKLLIVPIYWDTLHYSTTCKSYQALIKTCCSVWWPCILINRRQ